MSAASMNQYRFAEFTLDDARGLLSKSGVVVSLRPKSFELLRYLVSHPDRLISKRELLDSVWGDAVVAEGSLTRGISELRATLDDTGQQMIKTLARRGYLFAAPVTRSPGTLAFNIQVCRSELAAPAPTLPLIGRADVSSMLERAANAVAGGRNLCIVFVGTAGIGKSRMLGELAARLGCGDGRVLRMAASESARMLPLGPWIDGLRTFASITGTAWLDALAPPWRRELQRLLPELAHDEVPASECDRLRLFESVTRALSGLAAGRALGVFLDDAQWADTQSLEMLAYVARHAPAGGLVCALGLREEDPAAAHILGGVVADIGRDMEVVRIALEPLSRADTVALVGSADRLEPEVAQRIWLCSEGNPFFALEYVRTLREVPDMRADTIPPRISDIVAGRLHRLGKPARRILAAASVIGRDFDFELVRAVAAMAEEEAIACVEELVARRLLRATNQRLDFEHDLIRQATCAQLLAPRSMALHRRAALELERRQVDNAAGSHARVAAHWFAAAEWERAAEHWQRAANDALRQSAYREAVACLECALNASERMGDSERALKAAIGIRLDLYRALLPLGQPARVLDLLHQADDRAAASVAPVAAAWIDVRRANCLWLTGEHALATTTAERARRTAGARSDLSLRIASTFCLAQAHSFAGHYRESARGLSEILELLGADSALESHGLPGAAGVVSRAWLCWSLGELGEFEVAAQHGERAWDLAKRCEHPFSLVDAARALGCLYARTGRSEAALAVLEEGLAITRAREVTLWVPSIASALGRALTLAGRANEGATFLHEALASATAHGIVAGQSLRMTWLAEACLQQGDVETADSIARRAFELATTCGEAGHRAWCLHLLGLIQLQQRMSARQAEDVLTQALHAATSLGMSPLAAQCQQALLDARKRRGRPEAARALRLG